MTKTIKSINKKDLFQLVKKNGNLSNKIWKIDSYDRAEKKYLIINYNDINDWKLVKPTQLVETDIYF